MSNIRYTEIFYSLQGEGMYVGVPSIFLRTFGCNFRCKKFGIDRNVEVGKYNPEVEKIINDGLDKYKSLEDLPLVSTGCDTYSSIYPEFKRFANNESVDQIADRIISMLPDNKFSEDKHLIITGGEPLLGWQKQYIALFERFNQIGANLSQVTFETNGTQKLNSDLFDYLNNNQCGITTTFSISAKLPVSGEKWEDAIKPDVVKQYTEVSNNNSYFKFVVASQQDVEDAHTAIEQYRSAGINIPVYMMPIGGVNSVYEMNERQVADYCRDNGLRFSPRIQVPLYKNQWGT